MAVRPFLIDTGPIVAYLDHDDSEHVRIAEWLDKFSGALCTTSPVITEAMHLLKSDPSGPRRLAEFVKTARIEIFETTQLEVLLSAAALMEKYSDIPMDFADATLVLLAEHVRSDHIITLDRRGFLSFRVGKRKAFAIFP